MQNVEIKLFGVMRKYADHGRGPKIDLDSGLTAGEVKAILADRYGYDRALLSETALANDTHVLKDLEPIGKTSEISLLPPVCGG